VPNIGRIAVAEEGGFPIFFHSQGSQFHPFDEIDTGVSGRIADAMGEIIRTLSANMQVVAITHLPQVASKGDAHVVVYKEDSRTNITLLTENQRVEEIAKMLSGSVVTDAALEQARLLLKK
jgi:DNA repair protein RecN (Recombination protein N)